MSRQGRGGAEARKLLGSIDTGVLAGLRDRALLSVMLYSFARVSAVLGDAEAELLRAGEPGRFEAPREGREAARRPGPSPGGRALDAYVEAAGLEEPKAALFQSMDPAGRRLTGRALEQRVVLAMITAYLSNGGVLEPAQQIAGHASPKTTKLYGRTADTVTVDEIERIVI